MPTSEGNPDIHPIISTTTRISWLAGTIMDKQLWQINNMRNYFSHNRNSKIMTCRNNKRQAIIEKPIKWEIISVTTVTGRSWFAGTIINKQLWQTNNVKNYFSHNRYSKIMTNLWNEISDTADLNRDGAVTLQELQVKKWRIRYQTRVLKEYAE